MKHFILLLAAVLTLALLTGCSSTMDYPQSVAGSGGDTVAATAPIMDVLGDDMLSLYKNRGTALPAAVIYTFQGDGERLESPLYGDESINTVLDAIAEITVTGETDFTVTDSDASYTFINADGTEAGRVSFNGMFLVCGDKKYEIDKMDALADIDFPAETSRDALTLDGPDPQMYAFLEKCKTDKPVSIKVVRDASEYEISEPEAIGKAVEALYSVDLITYALQGAEPCSSTVTATFVMSDGFTYSLTFHDDMVYIYEYPEPLGVWSFYTDGAEYFIEAIKGAQ